MATQATGEWGQMILYVLAVAIPLAIGWCATIFVMLWTLNRTVNDHTRMIAKLLHMHENADAEGFGTVGLRTDVRQQAHLTRELIYYVKWGMEKVTATEPPPFVDKG